MKIEIECIDLTKGAKLPNLPASKGAFPTNGRADMTQTCFMSYLLSVPLALERKHKYKSKYLGIGYRFSWSHHEKKKLKLLRYASRMLQTTWTDNYLMVEVLYLQNTLFFSLSQFIFNKVLSKTKDNQVG